MSIRITAIICTYNRVQYLKKAIKSLVGQTLSKDDYEILVIDNGSTDNTREVVLGGFSYVQNLLYFYESAPGLSQARNTGWRKARGRYVAYLDDDAIASSQWLEKILDVFGKTERKIGCVGGKVEPIWEAQRPSWLTDKMIWGISILDWSKVPIILGDKEYFIGTNMAFPKDLLEVVGGFKASLGRNGDKLLSNEESLLKQQITERGYDCIYHPEINVWHHIPSFRLNKGWFIRRMYWQGVSDAIVKIDKESLTPLKRLHTAFFETRRILLSPRKSVNLIRPTDDPTRFMFKCWTLLQIGYILGLLGIVK